MESSDICAPDTAAKSATAGDEKSAAQVCALEAVIEHYKLLLSGAQEATREWERVFDAIEDPICVVTADYRLVHANAAYTRLFGKTPDAGSPHYCFIHNADGAGTSSAASLDRPCEDCPLPSAVHTRRPGMTQQRWQHHDVPGTGSDDVPGQHTRTYERWVYPVVNADGTVERIVEVIKDVTEQEQMRHTAARSDALREADRLKAELLGTVSHELRSPLTAIKGYAATLLRHERRLPREERREFLEAIGEASDRLEVIINRLLEMSQLETGSIVPHFAPVDVALVAREAVSFAEHRARGGESGRYQFSLHLRDDLVGAPRTSLVIDADARLLRDALDNLLENAVKYSPEGGRIDVTIGTRSMTEVPDNRLIQSPGAVMTAPPDEAAPRDMLEITVSDTGVGIPAEHLGRVFDRFHRVDTRLTREVDGLGLGLAMCARIAELHSGLIWAESTPGTGSAFHLVLPEVRSAVPSVLSVSTRG